MIQSHTYKNVGIFFYAIVMSNMCLAQSCQLPEKSQTQYDVDAAKDVFGINTTGSTDYFKLAISWSPIYCQKIQTDIAQLKSEGKSSEAEYLEHRNQFQCFSKNQFKWVVHGLWASSCDGKSLANCKDLSDIKKHPRFCRGDLEQLPYKSIKPFLCMTPSAELLQGEWEKHGACNFPSAVKYFKKSQALFAPLKLPDEKYDPVSLAQWIDIQNPKLSHKKINISDMEIYVCYNKNFEPIDCPPKN